MSKKDFQAIARALYDQRALWKAGPMSAVVVKEATWREARNALADVLAASNPRFDRQRFVEACETGRCKGMPR